MFHGFNFQCDGYFRCGRGYPPIWRSIDFFLEIKILHGDILVPVYHVQIQKICTRGYKGYLGLPGGVGVPRHIWFLFTM